MYTTIAEFIGDWNQEIASTQKLLDVLTDASLGQQVSPNGRTLGRIAWHLAASTPEFLTQLGLQIEMASDPHTVPASAKELAEGFRKISADAAEAIKQQFPDESLKQIHNVFGMQLPMATVLSMLIKHLIHHRGQLTVLMRQAGLKVPGVYGPSEEEWSRIGMEAPVI